MIINLTIHPATTTQIEAGVVDLPDHQYHVLRNLLLFEEIPTQREIATRARKIRLLAEAVARPGASCRVMIGGASFLLAALEREFLDPISPGGCQFTPVYAFSQRVSEEIATPDGGVRKVSTFKHLGFAPR